MDRIIKLEAKLKEKYTEHAWALVKQKEKEMIPVEMKIKKYERGLDKCDKEIDHFSIKLKEYQEEFTATKGEFEAIGNKAKEVHKERDKFSAEISGAKQARQELEMKLREINRDMQTCRKEKSFYEKNIQELRERANVDLTDVWEEREGEIDQLTKRGRDEGERLARMEEELEQSQDAHSSLREKLEGFQSRFGNTEDKIADVTSHMKQLQKSQTNRLNVFGDYMQALTDRIKSHARSFSQLPKGPIGAYLSVKEKKWALAVEACIDGKIRSFLVNNMNDRVLLSSLMKEVCRDFTPTIVVTSFTGRPYDIDRFRAESRYPTVFDMVTCADVDVMNYLVDSTKIETVILVEGQREATQVMWRSSPTNCSLAYTLAGDTIKKKGSFSNRIKRVRYLEEDVLKSIDSYQQNLEELQREKSKLKQMVDACQSEIQHQGRSSNKLRLECKQLNSRKKELERKVDDLRAKTSEEQKQQVEIEPFENALQESIHKEEQSKLQAKETSQRLQAAKSSLEEVLSSRKEVDERYEGLKEQMEGVKKKLNEIKEQKDEAKEQMKYFEEKRVSVEDVIRSDTAECEKMRDEAEQLASEALKKCGDRVDTACTPQALQSEMKETKKAIVEQQKSQKMSREECTQKLTKRLEDYNKHKSTMKVMTRLFNKLSVALQIRLNKHKELQDMIIIRASNYFQTHLSKRNYSGRIRFDAKSETLTLDVTTNKLNKQGTQNTCTLSGGERSYITVCFIMSLWETMESPFRCLDEFDVFMDMVNRAISIEIMMKTASDFPDRQFVFFTPLDMTSYISNNENVKILQLSQPERGQS